MLEERSLYPAKVSGFLGLSEICGHPSSGGSAQLGTTVRNKDLMTCSVRKILSLSLERPELRLSPVRGPPYTRETGADKTRFLKSWSQDLRKWGLKSGSSQKLT